MLFQNREHAARLLARRLSTYYKNKNPLVLAIPRSAIRMAEIIADALGGQLDVVLVHKLGHLGRVSLLSERSMKPAILSCQDTASILMMPILKRRSRRNLRSCASGEPSIRRRVVLSTPMTALSSWWTMGLPPVPL